MVTGIGEKWIDREVKVLILVTWRMWKVGDRNVKASSEAFGLHYWMHTDSCQFLNWRAPEENLIW